MQQAVAQIPWSHNVTIIEKVKDKEKREWYINKNIESSLSQRPRTFFAEEVTAIVK